MQMDLNATHAPYNVMQAPYVPALTHAAFETLARGGSIVSLDASSKKMIMGIKTGSQEPVKYIRVTPFDFKKAAHRVAKAFDDCEPMVGSVSPQTLEAFANPLLNKHVVEIVQKGGKVIGYDLGDPEGCGISRPLDATTATLLFVTKNGVHHDVSVRPETRSASLREITKKLQS